MDDGDQQLASSAVARRILHCDMDCFYAAVHIRDDPSLAGKPVVVGGRPDSRGVVAAASYEARRFGIHSAMPAAVAKRRCPATVFIPPDFLRYRAESAEIFAIYRRFTPLVQPASLDEAYLDVTDWLGDYGSATTIASEIKRCVRVERQLTVSVGVGPNRLIAKIASDFDKPDGLTIVGPSRVLDFLASLEVRRLHGVGPATERALEAIGVRTVEELRAIDRKPLVTHFGRQGETLWRFARGIDDRPVRTETVRKSLSAETTFGEDIVELREVLEALDRLACRVGTGLRKRELSTRTITLKVRYGDFTTVTRSLTVGLPVTDDSELVRVSRKLLERTEAGRRPIRLLGVGASKLLEGEPMQLPLFD